MGFLAFVAPFLFGWMMWKYEALKLAKEDTTEFDKWSGKPNPFFGMWTVEDAKSRNGKVGTVAKSLLWYVDGGEGRKEPERQGRWAPFLGCGRSRTQRAGTARW